MGAALQDRDRNALDRPEREQARVADRGRDRPAGDLAVRDLDPSSKLVGEAAEPAPEHDPDARHELRPLADPAYGVVENHDEPAARRAS